MLRWIAGVASWRSPSRPRAPAPRPSCTAGRSGRPPARCSRGRAAARSWSTRGCRRVPLHGRRVPARRPPPLGQRADGRLRQLRRGPPAGPPPGGRHLRADRRHRRRLLGRGPGRPRGPGLRGRRAAGRHLHRGRVAAPRRHGGRDRPRGPGAAAARPGRSPSPPRRLDARVRRRAVCRARRGADGLHRLRAVHAPGPRRSPVDSATGALRARVPGTLDFVGATADAGLAVQASAAWSPSAPTAPAAGRRRR